jgi:hypothetical protein
MLDGTVPSRSQVGSMVQNSASALAVSALVAPNSTPIRKSPLGSAVTLRMHAMRIVVTPERVGMTESSIIRSLTSAPV